MSKSTRYTKIEIESANGTMVDITPYVKTVSDPVLYIDPELITIDSEGHIGRLDGKTYYWTANTIWDALAKAWKKLKG